MHPKPVMVSYLPVLLRVNHKKGSWAYFFFKFSNQTNHFFLMSLVLCKGQLALVNPCILVMKGIHMLRKKWIFFLCFGHSTVAVAFLKKLWNPKKERNDNSQVLAAHGVVFINHHPKFFQDFSVQVPLDPSLLSSLCLQPIAWCISELAEDASILLSMSPTKMLKSIMWILSQTSQVHVLIWGINFSFLSQLCVSVMRSGSKPAHSY